MAKIFLSYRRQDSAGLAGRIYDRLRGHFGDDAVVMDIDAIPFGVDFRQFISDEVARCAVLLVVMGPRWLGRTGSRRRLDDPRDYVRIEIEAALQRGIPVIPVRIDRTRMPGEADLPASLAPLAYRNAIEVDQGRDFHVHVDRLIRGIEFHFRGSADPAPAAPGEAVPRPADSGQPPPSNAKSLENSLGMTLTRIEPGSFLMGSTREQIDQLMRLFPDSEREWFDDEQTQHCVAITRPFWLGAHPVTQAGLPHQNGDAR